MTKSSIHGLFGDIQYTNCSNLHDVGLIWPSGCFKTIKDNRAWCPLFQSQLLTLEAEIGGSVWVQGLAALQSEFQDNKRYVARPCH